MNGSGSHSQTILLGVFGVLITASILGRTSTEVKNLL